MRLSRSTARRFSARAAARPVPAHLPARARLVRRQEGLRRRRLRRLHGLARRHAGPQLPHARPSAPRAAQVTTHRGAGPGRRAAPDAAGVPRRPGVPVRLLHGRHDHDGGQPHRRGSAQDLPRALKGNLCRCTGYHAIEDAIHGVRSRRGGRRRPGLRRQPRQSRSAERSSPARPATRSTSRWRGCCTSRSCARRTPTPASSRIDKDEALAVPGVHRGLHLGGRAAPALHARPATRTTRRSRRHLHARQRRPLRRPAGRRRRRRDRGRRGGRLPAARGRVRGPAGRLRPRGGDARRARRSSTTRAATRSQPERNIFIDIHGEVGDVAAGFAEADAVHEGTYSTHARPARAPGDARLDRLARRRRARCTSAPARRRRSSPSTSSATCSACIRADVHVFSERVGGGFGGKQEMLTEDLCVLAALKTGRPVKWEFTREEQFIGATTRHPMTTHGQARAPSGTAR